MKRIRHLLLGSAAVLLLLTVCAAAWRQNRVNSDRAAAKDMPYYDEQADAVESFAEKLLEDLDLTRLLDPQGKTLRIVCPDERLEELCVRYLPLYEPGEDAGTKLRSRVLTKTGTYGDTRVIWTIIRGSAEAYENYLDELLTDQESKTEEDRLDLFVVTTDRLAKYCGAETTVALAMEELNLTEADLGSQYEALRSLSALNGGRQRAVTWELPFAVWLYNRDIAAEVLGSSDPEVVQEHLSDWGHFRETAELMQEAGYRMYSSYTETYASHLSQVSAPWVNQDNAIVFDSAVVDWIHMTMEDAAAGRLTGTQRGSAAWQEELQTSKEVFGFFVTPEELSSLYGLRTDLGVCEGPSSCPLEAEWLCAAAGTDNRELVSELMRLLTMDEETMGRIFEENGKPVNHRRVMRSAASDVGNAVASSASAASLLGGQNPCVIYDRAASETTLRYQTIYDFELGELLADAYIPCFQGTLGEAEALHTFYQTAQIEYPDLTG